MLQGRRRQRRPRELAQQGDGRLQGFSHADAGALATNVRRATTLFGLLSTERVARSFDQTEGKVFEASPTPPPSLLGDCAVVQVTLEELRRCQC